MLTKEMTLQEIYEVVLKKEIPVAFPEDNFGVDYWKKSVESFSMRRKFIEKLGFVKISKRWTTPLGKYLRGYRVLEVMSGNGALSKALKDEGVNITATDNSSWNESSWFRNSWATVEKLDAVEAVKKYGIRSDYIICSWPPYEDQIAYRVLIEMRKVNPDCKMIYIGEGNGGCTADDSFHEAIEMVNDVLFDNAVAGFQQWEGVHDHPMLVK